MTMDSAATLATSELVTDAVGARGGFGLRAQQEKLFARLFNGLVYAQIWEDPVVDMQAMAIEPHHHILTIASGGCNALSYLVNGPAKITAVDLSPAHVALLRLKIAGVENLPNWDKFYSFFGSASERANVPDYFRFLSSKLDQTTRNYWEKRNILGTQRIQGFSKNIYRKGLLGHFIGAGHLAARIYGLNLKDFLDCQNMAEQRNYFDKNIEPLFSKRLVKRVTRSPLSLFGLGIPPSQYEALAGERSMGDVLKERLEKLTCGYPLSENYFAWQAFGRAYAPDASGPLPPYLQYENFATLRRNVSRLTVQQANMTHVLEQAGKASVDRVVLLDAQDWMSDAQLNALWSAITAAARPGARVIFRTAGEETILPGRVHDQILSHWNYLAPLSAELHAKDRSSIYGGFHVYEFKS